MQTKRTFVLSALTAPRWVLYPSAPPPPTGQNRRRSDHADLAVLDRLQQIHCH